MPATPATPPMPVEADDVAPPSPFTQTQQQETQEASPEGLDLANVLKDELLNAPRPEHQTKKRIRRSLSKSFEEDNKPTGLTDSDDEDFAKFPKHNILAELQLPEQADGTSRFETSKGKDRMDTEDNDKLPADTVRPRLLTTMKKALSSSSAHNARPSLKASSSVYFTTPSKQDSNDEDEEDAEPAKLNLFKSTVEFYGV
jgi:hypothetical protein